MPVESVSAPDLCGLRRTRRIEDAIAQLAEAQHGVVGRWQLVEVGLSERAVEHRVATGRLRPVARGVYAVGRGRISRRGKWAAAVLTSGPDAALSHRSAAALWGIRDPAAGAVDVA